MKPEELVRMIDLDKSNVLELQELEEVICSLGDFSKKEVKSIHDFFDINNDGRVDYDEFMTKTEEGMKLHEKYLQRLSLKWWNNYNNNKSR